MDQISVNPFVCLNRYTFLDWIKMIVATPLVLIRGVCMLICFILVVITSQIAYLFLILCSPKDYYQVKSYYLNIPCAFFRLIFFFMGFYRIPIVDMSDSQSGPPRKAGINILVPHTSIYDLLAICRLNHVTCVARHQVKNIWFLSRLAQLGDPILVKRDDKNSRQTVLNNIKERVKSEEVMILPEGTCSNRQLMLQFKTGAFTPGLPVQPYGFIYDLNDWCFNNIDHTSWVREGPPLLLSMWITASKLWTSAKLVKLPVYEPNEEEQTNPNLYSYNVHKFVCKKLNIRRSFYSYDDLIYLEPCRKHEIPRSPACLRFMRFCTKLWSYEKTPKSSTNSKEGSQEVLPSESLTDSEMMTTIYKMIDKLGPKWEENAKHRAHAKKDLPKLFEITSDTFMRSTSYTDFVHTLDQIKGLKVKHLLAIALMCDNRQNNLWSRIEIMMSILTQDSKEQVGLSMVQFKNFLWILLGLEHSIFQEDLFTNTVIDYNFIRSNLATLFERAVKENAESLLGKY